MSEALATKTFGLEECNGSFVMGSAGFHQPKEHGEEQGTSPRILHSFGAIPL